MTKQDLRSIMRALSSMNVSDQDALKFIQDLAQNQNFKLNRAYRLFCTNCGIFYTSCLRQMTKNQKDYSTWQEKFISSCESLTL